MRGTVGLEVTVSNFSASACVKCCFAPFRFCELSDWLSSQRRQLRLLKETARNSSHQEQVTAAVEVRLHSLSSDIGLEVRLQVFFWVCVDTRLCSGELMLEKRAWCG